ncbi:MAG: hypothetical protein PUB20_03235 [Clostridia bacterium]|nr:hypothetical protein [Clostridia bacterium]
MKKKYIKPEIGFESFRLSTDIAAGCAMLGQQAPNACKIYYPEWGMTLLTEELLCDATPPSGTDYVCYHVPVADTNVFES